MDNMIDVIAIPQTEYASIKADLSNMKSRITELEALVKFYEGQFRLAQHRQFGASSEKTQVAEQLGLFNEVETVAAPDLPEPALEEITYKRKKRVGKREEDLSALPVETVTHTLPEDERICPECGEPLHEMGHETRRELTIIPARVLVTEHVRSVYSCRNCEKTADHTPIVKAPVPEPIIKGSLASPSAVAQIMTQKFVMCAPLYRQEADFKRWGVNLSRQTMANWVIRCAEDWLSLIYVLLKAVLLKQPVLHADETTLQVLHEPGKTAQSKSYMWLYRTSDCSEHAVILYEYQPGRSYEYPKTFLEGFTGYLHTDGYAAYHRLSGVTVIGCWSHMKRKWHETLKSLPEADRASSQAQIGMDYCDKLFAFEKKYAKMTPEERHEKRQAESRPLAEAYFTWVKSLTALPKTRLGIAVTYAREQEKWLMNVYLDGRLELSNNRAERSIKPFVMGRKNWLFSTTPKGAQSSAVVYSIIETAIENNLNPFEYLKYLFETMPNITVGMVETLLPWSGALPERCRSKSKEAKHANSEH